MNQHEPAKPHRPGAVLAASLVPGAGHVMLGVPMRGLQFIFFMIILGWVTNKLMPDGSSFIGRNIGGIFIYGLSVLDAYKIARIRFATFRPNQHEAGKPDDAGRP